MNITTNDLLQLLGAKEVEIAVLKQKLAEAEQKLAPPPAPLKVVEKKE